MKRSLATSYGAVVLCSFFATATPRSQPVQDACSHPITPQQWAAMTPTQRRFQQLADTVTQRYIEVVFGSGPYPPCLYQSVRDYFYAPEGATFVEIERARTRREYAKQILLVIRDSK